MRRRYLRSPPLPLALLVLIALCVASGSQARADIAPPARTACAEKKIGDSCSTSKGAQGTCKVAICRTVRNDPYDCVLCLAPDTKPQPARDLESDEPTPLPLFSQAPSPSTPPAGLIASPPQSAPAPPPPSPPAPEASAPPLPPSAARAGCGRCATAPKPVPALAWLLLLAALIARSVTRNSSIL